MLKRICNILNTVIMVILLIIACIFIVPKILGMDTLAVLSGSMEPNIPVGSIIVIDDVRFEDLKVNDVVTYSLSDSTLVTHRVIDIDNDSQLIKTKGDANDVDDGEPISFNRIVGKLVFSVPLLGYLSIYMKTPLGIAILCAIIFVLILLNFLPGIFDNEEKE